MKRYKLNLRLFDEGEGSTGAGAQDTQANSQVSGETADPTQQTQAAGSTPAEPTPEQLRAEFDELIKGKYKTLYDERVQGILKDRFKKYDGLEKSNKAMKKTISLMGQRYGTEDAAELYEKISKDASLFADQALEAGMSEEAFLDKKRVEFENKELQAEIARRDEEAKQRELFGIWHENELQMKQSFPDFSLEKELQNKEFVKLLTNGINMKTAYEVIHHDEVMNSIAQKTAAAVEKRQSQVTIPKRPSESGLSSGAIATKIDVSKLDAKQRRDLAQRARREQITFS